MSTFALLHGNAAFPASVPIPRGWHGPKRAPQWAAGLVAAAGPRRVPGCWGPGGGSDLAEPAGLSSLGPSSLLSLKPRVGNSRLGLAHDTSFAPPPHGPLGPPLP